MAPHASIQNSKRYVMSLTVGVTVTQGSEPRMRHLAIGKSQDAGVGIHDRLGDHGCGGGDGSGNLCGCGHDSLAVCCSREVVAGLVVARVQGGVDGAVHGGQDTVADLEHSLGSIGGKGGLNRALDTLYDPLHETMALLAPFDSVLCVGQRHVDGFMCETDLRHGDGV
jgi:hypothetical protein